MIGEGRLSVGASIEPDLMAAGGLPVKLESKHLQFSDYLAIAEPGESAHYAATTMV
jgi:hypothetical protein